MKKIFLALFVLSSCVSNPKLAVNSESPQPDSKVCFDQQTGERLPAGSSACVNTFDPKNRSELAAREESVQTKNPPEFDAAMIRVQKYYRDVEQKIYWKSSVEDYYDFSQFFRRKHLEANKTAAGTNKKSPLELFGLENYKAYVEARDYLNTIPQGQFRMSPELIKNTHLRSAEGLEKSLGILKSILPNALVEAGEFKKRNNFGGDPVKHPLTEDQYMALKANPYIKFIDMPWPFSRFNVRRGWIRYGDHLQVEKNIEDLSNWVNTNMGKMDPIRLAAEFQWRYVSIHPMVDGNGRTSMLLANRILTEHDLPPIMGTYSGYDIYYSPEKWTEQIKASVIEFENVMTDPKVKELLETETPNNYQSNFADGPRTGLLPQSARSADKKSVLGRMNQKFSKKWDNIQTELFAKAENQEVILGGRRFIAMMDGFFYDKYGVPYMLRGNTLYPIPDRTMTLLSEGGEIKKKRFFRRDLNPIQRENFRNFFQFMRAYKQGQNDGSQVKVESYDLIKEANNSAKLFLYDWQKPLFESVIEINDKDPAAILSRTRGYSTNYEKAFHLGDKVSLHDTLGQYLMADLKFHEYKRYAESVGRADWVSKIESSRDKLFSAAKELIDPRLTKLMELVATSPEKLESTSEWKLFKDYYDQSPLKYATRQEALREQGDNKIVLLRSDQSFMAETVGFLTNSDALAIAKMIPGYGLFKGLVGRYAQLTQNKTSAEARAIIEKDIIYKQAKSMIPGFDSMMRNTYRLMTTTKYEVRGVGDELDRMFVQHAMHAVNSPLKEDVSFSLSTANYIRSKFNEETGEAESRIPFSFDSKFGRLYFVKVDKSKVTVNLASKYFRQFEILGTDSVSRWNLAKEYGPEFFNEGVNKDPKFKPSKEIDTLTTVQTGPVIMADQ